MLFSFVEAFEAAKNGHSYLNRTPLMLRGSWYARPNCLKVASILRFLTPTETPGIENLMGAGRVIDFIASDIMNRNKNAQDEIVFNVLDRVKLPSVKHTLLSSCGITHITCQCTKSRKTIQWRSCPFFSNSQMGSYLKSLLANGSLWILYPGTDRTK